MVALPLVPQRENGEFMPSDVNGGNGPTTWCPQTSRCGARSSCGCWRRSACLSATMGRCLAPQDRGALGGGRRGDQRGGSCAWRSCRATVARGWASCAPAMRIWAYGFVSDGLCAGLFLSRVIGAARGALRGPTSKDADAPSELEGGRDMTTQRGFGREGGRGGRGASCD